MPIDLRTRYGYNSCFRVKIMRLSQERLATVCRLFSAFVSACLYERGHLPGHLLARANTNRMREIAVIRLPKTAI